MKVKELKISPVPEDRTFSKIYAHVVLLTPILPIIILSIFAYMNQEVLKDLHKIFLENKIFLILFFTLWLGGMLNMSRETLNYLLTEEVCYVKNKTFYYQKFRKAFGTRKLMKNLELAISEISEVREIKKPSMVYYFLNPVSHRNSVEIETKDGQKYKIMNSIIFGNRNTQNPTSEITSQRANKIYNEVKKMIFK